MNTLLHKQKYAGLGPSGVDFVYPPERLLGMFVGKFGSGKSAILQSNPDAFIINTDLTSTVVSSPPATIWPGVDSKTGQPLDADGSRLLAMDWVAIEKKLKILEDLATRGQPRPATVVLDSLTTLIPHLQRAEMLRMGKAHWKDMDGRAAWDNVYNKILDIALGLRGLGYGVYFTCHLVDSKIEITEQLSIPSFNLSVGQGLISRLGPLLEVCVPVFSVNERVASQVDDFYTNTDGRKVKKATPKTIFTDSTKHFIDFGDPRLSGIAKPRGNLKGHIPLELGQGWTQYVEAFRQPE